MLKSLTNFSLLFASLIASTTLFSQKILWEKSLGGKQSDYLMDAKPTADYGFILAGSSISNKSGTKTSNNKGDFDYRIWKMDEEGNLDWQESYGGLENDFLQSICLTIDGGFILGGTSSSNIGFNKKEDCKGQDDFWIIKLNAKGGEEWQKTIGGSGQEKFQNIIQTNDGGYILAGSSSSDKSGDKKENSFGNLDYWIVKLDSKGVIEWQKTLGGEFVDELRSVEQTLDGGYILGGYSNSLSNTSNKTENSIAKTEDSFGLGDYWVVKLDKNGTQEWQKSYGGNGDDQLTSILQTDDKGYLIGGNSSPQNLLGSNSGNKTVANENGSDMWILKIEEKGRIEWQRTYNFGNVDLLTSLVENEDHSFMIGGYAQSENIINSNRFENGKKKQKDSNGINDYIALKIKENGEEIWSKTVGSDGQDILKKVIETRDGGYLFAGISIPDLLVNNEEYSSNGIGNLKKEQNQNIQNLKNEVDLVKNKIENDINKEIKQNTKNATNKINDAIGSNDNKAVKYDSNLKIGGINTSEVKDENSLIGSGLPKNNSGNLNTKGTRDKRTNYGYADFWVVKLKDEKKPDKVKAKIEALPNPMFQFTNVIVGYDFETGTATVVDLAGRKLQQFEITSRTVPIDLGGYPEGIYIVNIKTNKQSDGIKIIKRSSN